jgi:glycosyltransferase involved in cell wall biosynthesis
MPPAISIVIPTYNREKLVGAAIRSVLLQTRRDLELVVWDDGSSDGTVDAAKEAAAGDPRVRVIAGEHAGVVRSVNAAAELAGAGQYFGWVDSDDGLAPTALEETAAVLEARSDVGVVYTDYLVMDAAGRIKGPGTRTKIPYSKDRLLIDFMTFHFRLMRREVFDKVGMLDERAEGSEDYDLCLRLSEITTIHHLARPLYYYRVHDNAISSAQRLKQIMTSKEAIERAIVRRGLDKEMELEVEIIGKFRLRQKKNA